MATVCFADERGESHLANVEMSVNGDKLTIVVDLGKEGKESSTGKSIIIASTEGNMPVPGRENIKVGLNVFRKK